MEENNDTVEDTTNNIEEMNKSKWKDLPGFVTLNPSKAAIFNDSELSGLNLSQFGTKYGSVPKKNDCSRIAHALMNGNLLPCNTRGESTFIHDLDIEATREERLAGKNNWDKLMSMNTRELIQFISGQRDASFLSKMKEWEEGRPQKERRVPVLQAINQRLKSKDVSGLITKSEPNMIVDKRTGKLVPDVVTVGR